MSAPAVQSVASRYSGRSDEKPPSMVLTDSTLELALNTFTQGRFRGKNHFRDLVNKYLSLPPMQHEKLVQDLQLEPLFKKIETEKRFKYLFALKRDMGDNHKNLRLCQRPLLQIISIVDSSLSFARESGIAAGLQFKDEALLRINHKVPKPLTNNLALDQPNSSLFPLPEMPSMLEGLAHISGEDANILKANEKQLFNTVLAYREHVGSLYMHLFNVLTQNLGDIEDYLAFYCDLYSHVDAGIRDFVREKLAKCFKSEYRGDVLGRNLSRDQKTGLTETGLLGGEERVRSLLGEATKKDDLLKKSLIPKRSLYDRKKTSQTPNQSSTKASSSRIASPERFKNRKRNYQPSSRDRKADKPDDGKDRDGDGSPKAKRQRKKSSGGRKGEYLSPKSFSEAWLGFFSSQAIMLVTAMGLLVDHIPSLDTIPLGGRLGHCLDSWRKICHNSWVCNVVEFGYKIPLKFKPKQRKVPLNPEVSEAAFEVLRDEALGLKAKKAVVVACHTPGEYISSYFAVPKQRSPGKFRPILNLKYFNNCVKKYKFTMEHLQSVRDWIRPGFWCVGLDLKDAFPHIAIHKDYRKYLRFNWLGELLEWVVLPFGLTCSPRVLTKINKPVIAFLRTTWGILITIYMDDMLIQASSPEKAIFHAQLVMLTFMALGWSFNFEKCNLVPSQEVVHLGFVINTVSMTISCPLDKIVRLQDRCRVAFANKQLSVHDLERLLGTMESVRQCVPLAAMHYRSLQKQLLFSKLGRRKPKKIVVLVNKSLLELQWWLKDSGFISHSSAPISELQPTLHIWSDANLEMGGARTSRGNFSQREWTSKELMSNPHINLLEIRAAREGINALANPGDRVRLHLDNATACAYIRKQGGTKSFTLSEEACLLWEEALTNNVQILTPHWLSTKDNIEADFLSRNKLTQWEFFLDQEIFQYIIHVFQVQPTLDAFASKNTAQLARYMSWYPDNFAVAQDALLHRWDKITYLFPPVPLLLKVLKLVREQAISAILVCPQWPTALWWPTVVDMMVGPPLQLPHFRKILKHVEGNRVEPYLDPLVAVHISARASEPAI